MPRFSMDIDIESAARAADRKADSCSAHIPSSATSPTRTPLGHHEVLKDETSSPSPSPSPLPPAAPPPHVDDGLKFRCLGWKRLTICLIVEAIALGALSVPSAFAAVGMVAGVVLCVGLGLVAIYTSYVVGQVKLRHPHVQHYADAVQLIWGRAGAELAGVMFVALLVLLVGSHALTGTIALVRIVGDPGVCALVWGIVAAVLLFALALPPTFSEFAILGYIDFASIVCAIGITIVAAGVSGAQHTGGLAAVDWSLWPPPDMTFTRAFLAVTNIVFAYSFAVCQFSFMAEMHTPAHYVRSVWALGLTEIITYTVTGALIYAFVGNDVASPALLSAGPLISRVAFAVALPVIFISGSINSVVVGRYVMTRAFARSSVRFIADARGWAVWVTLISVVTVVAWIIAEAIPFFNALLGIISALFISGFSFYFPALFWFQLIKEGKWYRGWRNLTLSLLNAAVFVLGMVILVGGTWASASDIIKGYRDGNVRGSFSCDAGQYR